MTVVLFTGHSFIRPTRRWSEWLARHAVWQFGARWRASHRSPLRYAFMGLLFSVFSFFVMLLPGASFAQGTSGGGMNLIGNGSFELVTPDGNISPWFWSTCLSLIIAEPQHVADGSNCAIVCGGLYQDVSVVPGMMYQLKFAFGGDDQAQANSAPLTVSWGTQTLAAIPVDPVSMQSPNWRYLTYDLLASGSTVRLGFSTLPDQAFPVIDNVSLTPVPEPSVLGLLAFAGAWRICYHCREKRAL
jgi:hypothetical protein